MADMQAGIVGVVSPKAAAQSLRRPAPTQACMHFRTKRQVFINMAATMAGCGASRLCLPISYLGLVAVPTAVALEFAADRADRTAKPPGDFRLALAHPQTAWTSMLSVRFSVSNVLIDTACASGALFQLK